MRQLRAEFDVVFAAGVAHCIGIYYVPDPIRFRPLVGRGTAESGVSRNIDGGKAIYGRQALEALNARLLIDVAAFENRPEKKDAPIVGGPRVVDPFGTQEMRLRQYNALGAAVETGPAQRRKRIRIRIGVIAGPASSHTLIRCGSLY